MTILITGLIGLLGGWFGHSLAMRVRFKEKTVEYKVKVFDSLLTHWVQMRNFIYAHHPAVTNQPVPADRIREFDQMYGNSQRSVGQALLVCASRNLTKQINDMNERMYRNIRLEMPLPEINKAMEDIKGDVFSLIHEMRADIESDTRLTLADIGHIFKRRPK